MPFKQSYLRFTLVITSVMLLSISAHAEQKKVGVAVSAIINGTPGLGTEVSEALGAALEATLDVAVIAGAKAQALLPESARSETCLGDSACLVAAGKALGVDELLMLIIVGGLEDLKVEATWVNVATGATALRPAISVGKTSITMAEQFSAKGASLIPNSVLQNSDTSNSKEVVHDENKDNSADRPPEVEVTQAPNAKPGRRLSGTALTLGLVGGAATAGWVAYGLVRRNRCSGFNNCADHKVRDIAADVVGVAGIAAMSAALYLYYKSDSSASDSSAPLTLNLDGKSLALSYGGRF